MSWYAYPQGSGLLVRVANPLADGSKISLGKATVPFGPGCPEVFLKGLLKVAFELLLKEDSRPRADSRPSRPYGSPSPVGGGMRGPVQIRD